MAEIEKAPLSKKAERFSFISALESQRDADHEYYLREFIRWLRRETGIFISLNKLGLLQKEAEV